MDSSQINATFQAALNFLSQNRLRNTFDKTYQLTLELQIGSFTDRCDELQQNYRYMLSYYIDGVNDPQQKIVYNKLVSRLFVLLTELREELLFRNSTNLEYTQKRYFPHKLRFSNYQDLSDALVYYHSQKELFAENENRGHFELHALRSNFEKLLPDLFSIFWLSTRYEQKEKLLLSRIYDTNYPGLIEKSLVVTALTLNLWRMFDESKIMILFDLCQSEISEVRQRALVGLCFVLVRYNRFIPFFPAIRNRLVLMSDDSSVSDNLSNILIQIVATGETDKITKKMQEEILPELLKMSPMLRDRMGDASKMLGSEEWEEANPDWQEMLESTGIGEMLQEFSELQMEGADVYMSTFALLKNFGFFNELSNWFVPFDKEFNSVNDLFKSDARSLISAIMSNNGMCNSDKYSFCLSLLQMPESQREMLKSNFEMESEQLEEMAKDQAILTPGHAAKNLSKQYIQDLFRFFKLHPQRSDFSDMFESALSMHRSFLFGILAANSTLQLKLAEYYFTKSHFEQALELFRELASESEPTAAIYQKIAFSLQQLSRLPEALEAYLKADIIQPDDLWTIRKIALCYRLIGDYEKALSFYRHAAYLNPESQPIQMNIGNCLVELENYKEALAVFYKVDAFSDNNYKVWKSISWCCFVSGNLEQADYYLKKLMDHIPDEQDFVNAGHVAWCRRKPKEALSYYSRALELLNHNTEILVDTLQQDKQYLLANGIDKDEFPLMLDELLYTN